MGQPIGVDSARPLCYLMNLVTGETTLPNEEILIVKNDHPAASGRPPVLRTGKGYISYFENDRGEQFFLWIGSQRFSLWPGATLAGKNV